jgi:nucleotide-binding universal stress UspA family protein
MKLLCPYDFSPRGDHALDFACQLAKKYNGEVHILHVLTPQYIMTENPTYLLADELIPNVKIALEQVKTDFASKYDLRLGSFNAEVEVGSIVQAVENYLKENTIDAVCINTHNKSGFFYKILGSVAENIIENIEHPIILIHDEDSAELPSSKVLYLIDDVNEMKQSLETFIKFNSKLNLDVDLIHFEKSNHHGILEWMSYFRTLATTYNCNFGYEFIEKKSNDLYLSIQEQLKLENYDLVVFTPRHRSPLKQLLFESTTMAMLHKINKPILILK